MYGIVYKITNLIDGKIYVGQTRKRIEVRFAQHVGIFRQTSLINQAIREVGQENFRIEQLDNGDSGAELNEKEKLWIARCGSIYPDGYNYTAGGSGYTPIRKPRPDLSERNRIPWSEERRERFIKAHPRGADHFAFGKPGKKKTPETRAKIAARAKGRIPSAETRRKLGIASTARHAARRAAILAAGGSLGPKKRPSKKGLKPRKRVSDESRAARRVASLGEKNPFFGKKHSEETRRVLSEKISKQQMGAANPFFGRKHSEETKEKIRQSNLGKKMTPEAKEKIGRAFRGKKLSDEVRQRMSEAQQKIGYRPWLRGRTFSEEHKQRIGASKIGRKLINGKYVFPSQ